MQILPLFTEDEGLKASSSISLLKNMHVLTGADAQIISRYMASCAVIDEWLSNVKDPITNQLAIPSKTWCDGVYVWNSSHIHYVKHYRVRLPPIFVEHVKSRSALGFHCRALDKDALRTKVERILASILSGDHSFFTSYDD